MLSNKNYKLKINKTCDLRVCYAFLTVLLCSLIALSLNQFIYQFPGNAYLPNNTLFIASVLFFTYLGFFLEWGYNDKRTKIIQEIIFYFLIMGLIGIATNAVQYTPYSPIDQKILQIEKNLGINSQSLVAWSYMQPSLNKYLGTIYNTLDYQMAYIPLLMIISGHIQRIRKFYFYLLISTLIGFCIYYFFPTTAPASMTNARYYSPEQHATALKFMQIHQYIPPTTNAGGLIAFPSFHVIWACYCCYLLKVWRYIFVLSILFNLILVASCVLLGWHYCLDILGSILIIYITHYLYQFNFSQQLLKFKNQFRYFLNSAKSEK